MAILLQNSTRYVKFAHEFQSESTCSPTTLEHYFPSLSSSLLNEPSTRPCSSRMTKPQSCSLKCEIRQTVLGSCEPPRTNTLTSQNYLFLHFAQRAISQISNGSKLQKKYTVQVVFHKYVQKKDRSSLKYKHMSLTANYLQRQKNTLTRL